jgi:hypothetical protein
MFKFQSTDFFGQPSRPFFWSAGSATYVFCQPPQYLAVRLDLDQQFLGELA